MNGLRLLFCLTAAFFLAKLAAAEYAEYDFHADFCGCDHQPLHASDPVLPNDLVDLLKQMAKAKGPSILKIRNGLDLTNASKDAENQQQSSGLMQSIAKIMQTDVMCVPEVQEGQPLQQFKIIKAKRRGSQCGQKLQVHLKTDRYFAEQRPDFVLFFLKQCQPSMFMDYLSLKAFLANFDEETLQAMQKPQFSFPSAVHRRSEAAPILSRDERGHLRVRLCDRPNCIRPMTLQAKNVLKQVKAQLKRARAQGLVKEIEMKQGDVLVINNGFGDKDVSGVMHSPKGTMTQWWMQRAYLKHM